MYMRIRRKDSRKFFLEIVEIDTKNNLDHQINSEVWYVNFSLSNCIFVLKVGNRWPIDRRR